MAFSDQVSRLSEQVDRYSRQLAEECTQRQFDIADVRRRLASLESRDEGNMMQVARREVEDLLQEARAQLKHKSEESSQGNIVSIAVSEALAAMRGESDWWHKEIIRLDGQAICTAKRIDSLEGQLERDLNHMYHDYRRNGIDRGAVENGHDAYTMQRLAEQLSALDSNFNSLRASIAEARSVADSAHSAVDKVTLRNDDWMRRSEDRHGELSRELAMERRERADRHEALANKMEVGLQALIQKLDTSYLKDDEDDMQSLASHPVRSTDATSAGVSQSRLSNGVSSAASDETSNFISGRRGHNTSAAAAVAAAAGAMPQSSIAGKLQNTAPPQAVGMGIRQPDVVHVPQRGSSPCRAVACASPPPASRGAGSPVPSSRATLGTLSPTMVQRHVAVAPLHASSSPAPPAAMAVATPMRSLSPVPRTRGSSPVGTSRPVRCASMTKPPVSPEERAVFMSEIRKLKEMNASLHDEIGARDAVLHHQHMSHSQLPQQQQQGRPYPCSPQQPPPVTPKVGHFAQPPMVIPMNPGAGSMLAPRPC